MINTFDCNNVANIFRIFSIENRHLIKFIVQNGADLDAVNNEGRTALHEIAFQGDVSHICFEQTKEVRSKYSLFDFLNPKLFFVR